MRTPSRTAPLRRIDGRHLHAVVIGAGFSGIGFGIKLKDAGFDDFLILDEATGPGGTWHWNTYPGIAVDIPSFSYQFSFEKRPDWSRSYAKGNELKNYAEHCVEKYHLQEHLRFGYTVTAAEWMDDAGHWRISAVGPSGDVTLTATFVVNACGILSRPNLPDIEGVGDFDGITMHTSRWDHNQDLRGKRVAIIGTGASAVQIIPAIAPEVAELTVFQRTPIWCMPKPDFPLGVPIRWCLKHLPFAQATTWLLSQTFVEATFPVPAHYEGRLHLRKPAEKLALAYLRSQVKDPVTRSKLTPEYGIGCKRPSFHNSYLATFNRANVHLETSPITRITSNAVHSVDAVPREIDVLILATGFKVMDPDNMPTYRLRGAHGDTMAEWFQDRRLQSYEGISLPGFPNYFTIFGPYGYNGSSYFNLIEAQTEHILRVLVHARDVRATYVEVTEDANDRFFAEMMQRRRHQIFWQDSCARANSYYFDKHGDVPLRPTTTLESKLRSRRFDLADYTMRTSSAAAGAAHSTEAPQPAPG